MINLNGRGDWKGFIVSTVTEPEAHLLQVFDFCIPGATPWVLLEDLLCGWFYKSEINGTVINDSSAE